MSPEHARRLVQLGLVVPFGIPVILGAFALIGPSTGFELMDVARASAVCVMLLLAVLISAPLALPYPAAERRRGFVVFWFVISAFFNATWQIPLIVFRGTITTAEPTWDNLRWFIPWWGYGFADAHYGEVTPWMMAEEAWWLLAIAMSVVGLVLLRRGREAHAWVWLGVAGALEAYNATLYIVENILVDGLSNIAADSLLSQMLYWGFNLMWPFAAGLASWFSFRFLLDRVSQAGVRAHAEA